MSCPAARAHERALSQARSVADALNGQFGDYEAVLREGDYEIDIWDGEDHLFTFPVRLLDRPTPPEIRRVAMHIARVYRRGFDSGEQSGAITKTMDIQRALGL